MDSVGKGDLVHDGTELFLYLRDCVQCNQMCVHIPAQHTWPGGTLFSSDADGKAGDASSGDEVGKQWHEWKERMTPCLALHGPLLFGGEREAVCKQNWLCSEGKAAFGCQYGLQLGKVSGILL